MPHITVDQATYDKLAFGAWARGVPIATLIQSLVDRSAHGNLPLAPQPTATTTPEVEAPDTSAITSASTWLPVFKTFKGQRYEGAFNPNTTEVRVDTAPWTGKVFPSPTSAAQAVVTHASQGRVTPNTNGRKFWHLTDTGKDLRSIIGERV